MSIINEINITKASVHNLKAVSVTIPKNKLTVITGPSGSGKSSLAFDTIYVEGQRRYIESLSSYARQFLGVFQPPDVESITGLSPAIAIDQKSTNKNPRSTVGTTTEIYDYLRILYARIGTAHDPKSKKEIKAYSPIAVARELKKLPMKTKIQIISPTKTDDLKNQINKFLSLGMTKAYLNNELINLEEVNKFSKGTNSLNVIIDRVLVKDEIEKRLIESIELAYKTSNGVCEIILDDQKPILYSEKAIDENGNSYPELSPQLFSFNSPIGACTVCNGLGETKIFDLDLLVVDPTLPVLEGSIPALTKRSSFLYKMVETILDEEGVKPNCPLNKLPKKIHQLLFYGSEKIYRYSFTSENSHFEFSKPFPGLTNWFEKKFLEATSEKVRVDLEKYMNIKKCHSCGGFRLNPFALSTTVGKKNIMEISSLSVAECYTYFSELSLTGEKKQIATKLIKEITSRLKFLIDVGLNYLTLSRAANTLSGGESQRIRLATQIGSALTGVLYVLDEPSIGLHQRDNDRLIRTLKSLRDLGNTVIVVEHDEDTIKAADYLVDMGPGAGVNGGNVVAAGTVDEVSQNKKSITGPYLNHTIEIETPHPSHRRKATHKIELTGVTENNILNLDVTFPVGSLTCVTGVSGSGKSTLIHKVLVPAIKAQLSNESNKMLYTKSNFKKISGLESIRSIIELDQSPIGRTPHSNPATYTGLFDEIRTLYSNTPEAKARGYKPGRFSFNVKGGRCEECEGDGVKKIEMHFLPDVYISCTECGGTRFNSETLSVLYRGKSISDILNLTIEEAESFFKNHPKLYRILNTLTSVGLGYMSLGQPATTLSGGEAQRLKLSRELAKKTKGNTLYVLDEPTTGLHFSDIKILLKALQELVQHGHTLIIIEHNLDVIKIADHVIDLGPEGGSGGGKIIACGTPEQVAANKNSPTGFYLKKLI